MIDNTPILVGAGQYLCREQPTATNAPSPLDIAARAAQAALHDAGMAARAAEIDTLVVVRAFLDSIAAAPQPFGRSSNPPCSLARRIGAQPRRLIYSGEGGHTPQRLVNEMAQRIAAGEVGVALIAGGEATAAMKQALRAGLSLDWSETLDSDFEDRGFGALFTDHERAHAITFPTQVYALLENAWRARHGFTVAQHNEIMAELFAGFSRVAAGNPYAQFPLARSPAFLAAASPDNYRVALPYTKWLVAQDAVNQGAAVVMTSVGRARALGIPDAQWVYLHGSADVDDRWVSQRAELGRSRAMELALPAALAAAGKAASDMAFIDLYSCFPVAVLTACDALGIDWRAQAPLTVTGGLPFFGGPGNNYSLHAIARSAELLRATPGAFALVSANGGYLSKQSVGVYSTLPSAHSRRDDSAQLQRVADDEAGVGLAERAEGAGVVETYTLTYAKDQPQMGIVIGRLADGRRFLARTNRDDRAAFAALQAPDVIGRSVHVTHRESGNYVQF